MTKEKMADDITLYNIASVKGYTYAQEYDPNSGVTRDRNGYHYLKQGYIAGFLAGFTHKMGGGHGGD